MNNNKKFDKKYLLWKATLSSYVFRIIRRTPEEIDIDLYELYEDNFHPYIGAVMVILESDEYKQKIFYHDFIIPYNNRVIIVDKNT